MYFLRAAVLSFAAFFAIYTVVSAAVACAWRLMRNRAAVFSAPLLYGIRILPFSVALLLVLLLVIPSFLYLEPLRTDETFGPVGLAMAYGGIFVVAFGGVSAFIASWNTKRFLASCARTQLRHLKCDLHASAVQIVADRPMLLVAGVRRPELLISESAIRLLDKREITVAIRHELAHVSAHDNFKKLILRAVRFPFLSSLERTWMQAAELAADDVAATDERAAVDLASALLKVASQSSLHLPDLAMGLVPDAEHALKARVARLLAWQPRKRRPAGKSPLATLLLPLLALLAISYGPLLHYAHELTELLMH